MLLYGDKAVRAMRRVLRFSYGQDPDWRHPVLLMTAKLFQGDPAPVEFPQLETYFQNGHHAAVLAAASNIKAAAFQVPIEAALSITRAKWR
ncbi:MAG: hypothetical protein E5X11_03800 [Mesorhizobium sp.]|nr:MAG: hypothetical protein E5X11_03800 [Mesorhizobium sp.]